MRSLDLWKWPVVLLSVLFSAPDARIFGLTTATLLFLIVVCFAAVLGFKRLPREFVALNLPFIFLCGTGFFASLFLLSNVELDDFIFVFNKNKDLLTELLLSAVLIVVALKKKSGLAVVVCFVDTFFLFNFLYYGAKIGGFDLVSYFHQSIAELDRFAIDREPFLGYEPSYSGPVALLFSFIYLHVCDSRPRKFLIGSAGGVMVLMSDSKTVYFMLPVLGLVYFWFLVRRYFDRMMSLAIYSLTVIGGLVGVVFLLGDVVDFSMFDNFAALDPLVFGSFLTRSESMSAAFKIFFENPLGYGYGSAVLELSDYIEGDLGSLVSYEHAISSRYAKTPKSQFLEFLTGGGVLFLGLFVWSWRVLFLKLHRIEFKSRRGLVAIFMMGICAIFVGERLPFILMINFVFLSACMIEASKGRNPTMEGR